MDKVSKCSSGEHPSEIRGRKSGDRRCVIGRAGWKAGALLQNGAPNRGLDLVSILRGDTGS